MLLRENCRITENTVVSSQERGASSRWHSSVPRCLTANSIQVLFSKMPLQRRSSGKFCGGRHFFSIPTKGGGGVGVGKGGNGVLQQKCEECRCNQRSAKTF